MSNAPRHAGRVTEDGQLTLADPSAWRGALARHRGRAVYVTVARIHPRATQDQHGYYRAVILPLLAEEWGWSRPSELHEALKREHIPVELWVEEWQAGKLVLVPPSTADLDVEQYSAFLQAVLDHAAEDRIAVPPPRGSEAA